MTAEDQMALLELADMHASGKLTEAQYDAAVKLLEEPEAEPPARLSLDEGGLPLGMDAPLAIAAAVRQRIEDLAGKAFPPAS